ncbi:helix-turn-helix domain-containing protein [Xenorhabdus kozodoii]|uniref:helix-turn-helix domain-containing protein n=1 Tax=Xenorhabdus kozodoii TaxID=351676 RepID=UPI0030D841FC
MAEFENDLRSERQAERIAKAKENGVRFGRPAKLTETLRKDTYLRRQSGSTIGQLAKKFKLGEATIYHVLNAFKRTDNS